MEIPLRAVLQPAPVPHLRAGERAKLLPKDFDEWFAHCLQRNAGERWPSVGAAVLALERILRASGGGESPSTLTWRRIRPFDATYSVSGGRGPPSQTGLPPTISGELRAPERVSSAPATDHPPARPPRRLVLVAAAVGISLVVILVGAAVGLALRLYTTSRARAACAVEASACEDACDSGDVASCFRLASSLERGNKACGSALGEAFSTCLRRRRASFLRAPRAIGSRWSRRPGARQ